MYCYDVGRLMMTALATARPLTGVGVKQALEKIKMLPAATGAPGTRLRFGKSSGTAGWAVSFWSPAACCPTPAASSCTAPSRACSNLPRCHDHPRHPMGDGFGRTAQLREVIDRPDLELVGLYVYSPSKVGVDAGALVGRPPTGVLATNEASAILDWMRTSFCTLPVKHSPTTPIPKTSSRCSRPAKTSSRQLRTTTCRPSAPTPTSASNRACPEAGTRFHAEGEHPGFMFERLATSITALSQRVDKITVQEFVDCRAVTAREMLVDLMGMGKAPEEITVESAMFRAISLQYEQSLAAAADVLGSELRRDQARHQDGDGAIRRRGRMRHTARRIGCRPDPFVVRLSGWCAGAGRRGVLDCRRRHPRLGCRARRPVPRPRHRRRRRRRCGWSSPSATTRSIFLESRAVSSRSR